MNEYPPGCGVPQVKTAGLNGPVSLREIEQARLYLHAMDTSPSFEEYLWKIFAGDFKQGQAFRNKRKIYEKVNVVAEVNNRNPALAAEQRQQGKRRETFIAERVKMERYWRKLNFGMTYGAAARSYGWE